jgi:HEAT repeat protein
MHVAKLTTKAMIWFKTLLVAGVYIIAICLIFALVFSKTPDTLPFLIALSFLTIQTSAIVILILFVACSRLLSERNTRRAEKIYPLIREKLATYTLGDDEIAELQHLNADYPHEVEHCLAEFLTSVVGEPQTRLSALATKFGLVKKWQRQCRSFNPATREQAILRVGQLVSPEVNEVLLKALDDREAAVRAEAYRALIRAAKPEQIAKVFSCITHESLLMNALLADELQPHALFLVKTVIPEIVASGDMQKIIATFELLAAWKKVLPLPDVLHLLDHPQAEVRAKSLRALSYTSAGEELENRIVKAFSDPEDLVKVAAAYAAARLKIGHALHELEHCLQDQNAELRRASAYGLAQIGGRGIKVLEREMLSTTNKYAAATALEMLERVNIDRCEYI